MEACLQVGEVRDEKETTLVRVMTLLVIVHSL